VESVEMAGSGYVAIVRLVGETDARFQTRWKERDGTPTMVEFSHIAESETTPAADVAGAESGTEA
jgi:hypothetical protein